MVKKVDGKVRISVTLWWDEEFYKKVLERMKQLGFSFPAQYINYVIRKDMEGK